MDLLKGIKNNWQILSLIVGLIIGGTMFNARLIAVEAKQESVEDVIIKLNEMDKDISIVQTDVSWIKQNLIN